MYELVNTSVPNGLVSGTHGYATVAMTKGMPDAVRSRVEGFCAYPHRTSAHDASYFAENPVNWFHLVTPSGEHVVGRTAPAEFDYTGRTNRVSRVLYFPAREMPSAGGAAVLLVESARLCEGWSGEPRYLSVDGDVAERLRRIGRPSDGGAPHWTQLFGAEGETLARRFAVLLAQNVRSGRGIFFKASNADVDGRRLLGLFADLIALVPEELAAQVTFSTFAACVPGGINCHLRGVYDSDRAFETMATMQPWVDCESGRVRNPELLPAAETAAAASLSASAPSGGGAPSGVAETTGGPSAATTSRVMGRPVGGGRPIQRPLSAPAGTNRICVKNSNDAASYWNLGSAAALAVLVVAGIVLCILALWKSGQSGRGGKEFSLMAEFQRQEFDAWYAGCTNDVARLREQLDAGETSKDAERLLEQAERNKQDLKASAEEDGLVGYENRLRDAERQYDELIAAITQKVEALKANEKSAEEARRKKEEDEAKEKSRNEEEAQKRRVADAQADNAVAKAVAKQKEANKAAEMPFGEINVDEVFFASEKWSDRLFKGDKKKLRDEKLAEEGAIVYYFPSGGKVERRTGCVAVTTKKDPMSGNKSQTFSVKEPSDMKSARWCVAYVPSLGKAYWQWRSKSQEPVRLFKDDGDRADLAKVVFDGCQDETLDVYRRFLQRKSRDLVYLVSWDDGASSLRSKEAKLSIERFKPDTKANAEEVERIEKQISDKKTAIATRTKEWESLDVKFNELKSLITEYNEQESKKKSANKLEDKDKEKKNKAKKDASGKMEELKQKSEDKIQVCGFRGKTIDKISIEECDKKQNEQRENYKNLIDRMENELKDLRTKLSKTEAATAADWRERCRERGYVVGVENGNRASDNENEME